MQNPITPKSYAVFFGSSYAMPSVNRRGLLVCRMYLPTFCMVLPLCLWMHFVRVLPRFGVGARRPFSSPLAFVACSTPNPLC